MEGMTMTLSLPHQSAWTIDDLDDLTGPNRYEIIDGSLIVNPPPAMPHCRSNDDLRAVLDRQAPDGFRVLATGAGIARGDSTCLVPDLLVMPETLFRRSAAKFLAPADVLLVAEILSPGNARIDLVQKRYEYAAAGIPQYWIVDLRQRTLTVLTGDGYSDETTVKAGETWHSETPFPLDLNPADFT
jgi:Uma2 family endonuclease